MLLSGGHSKSRELRVKSKCYGNNEKHISNIHRYAIISYHLEGYNLNVDNFWSGDQAKRSVYQQFFKSLFSLIWQKWTNLRCVDALWRQKLWTLSRTREKLCTVTSRGKMNEDLSWSNAHSLQPISNILN